MDEPRAVRSDRTAARQPPRSVRNALASNGRRRAGWASGRVSHGGDLKSLPGAPIREAPRPGRRAGSGWPHPALCARREHRSRLSGWTIALGVPEAVVDGPLRASLWFLTGAAALTVLIGTTLALIVGRRLERPMLGLVRAAPRLVKGEVITLPRSSVTELQAVGVAVETASRELIHGQQAAAALARVSQAFTDIPDVAAVVG